MLFDEFDEGEPLVRGAWQYENDWATWPSPVSGSRAVPEWQAGTAVVLAVPCCGL